MTIKLTVLLIPEMYAAFNGADCDPPDEVVPHPLITSDVFTKVWVTSNKDRS